MALCSQRVPNSRSSVPTASCSAGSGIDASETPGAAISATRTARPAAVPSSAGFQPRVTPTASTIVKASMNSTIEARKDASTVGAMVDQVMAITLGRRRRRATDRWITVLKSFCHHPVRRRAHT